jgi:acetolactate synthase small subunit
MLGRVVLLFHRLQVEIEWIMAERIGQSDEVCITIRADITPDMSRRVEANLCKFVDVLSVEIQEAMRRTSASEETR